MRVPFHRYWYDADEEAAVRAVLASGWLTAGAEVVAFEHEFAAMSGAPEAVAVSSCTAGLEVALAALGLRPGDEVIVPTLTFAATANVVVRAGGRVVFADVDPLTLNLSPAAAEAAVTSRTVGVLAVHLGGHPCALDALTALCDRHGLWLLEDCAHAQGATFGGRSVGLWGAAGSFSFYPTKNITTGEGGMLLSQNLCADFRRWRLHGVDYDAYAREQVGGVRQYDIVVPGFKANMTDMEAALGRAQLRKWPQMQARRRALVARYNAAFDTMPQVRTIQPLPGTESAHHLYILEVLHGDKADVMAEVAAAGVQLSVHFKPVHLFSYYQTLGWREGMFPAAEAAFARMFSLPLYPLLTDAEADFVVETVAEALRRHG